MKKKLLLVLLSVAMVMTMMPLSVFAQTEQSEANAQNKANAEAANTEIATEIPGTGITLYGDREALPYDEETKTGDYQYSEGSSDITIMTDNWAIGGSNATKTVIFNLGKEQNKVTLKSLEVANLNFENGTTLSDDSVNLDLKTLRPSVVKTQNFGTQANTNFIGRGTIDTNGISGSASLAFDGTTVFARGNGILATDFIDIYKGKVVTNCGYNQALYSGGQVTVYKAAEVFSSGALFALGSYSFLVIDEDAMKVDEEMKTYEEAESVTKKADVAEVYFAGAWQYIAVLADNPDQKALTIYQKGEPETTCEVDFMVDGSVYETQYVFEDEKATKPADPQKAGHEFTGWYLDEKATEAFDFDTPITADLVLYAGWKEVGPGPGPEPGPTPTPTPDDPTNPDNPSTGGGASTGDVAMPIALIVLGLGAATTAFVTYRKLRDR